MGWRVAVLYGLRLFPFAEIRLPNSGIVTASRGAVNGAPRRMGRAMSVALIGVSGVGARASSRTKQQTKRDVEVRHAQSTRYLSADHRFFPDGPTKRASPLPGRPPLARFGRVEELTRIRRGTAVLGGPRLGASSMRSGESPTAADSAGRAGTFPVGLASDTSSRRRLG